MTDRDTPLEVDWDVPTIGDDGDGDTTADGDCLTVTADDAERVDAALARMSGLSRSLVQ